MIQNNKRGISGVIVAVIMIALVMVTTLIVWAVVTNIIKSKLDYVGSCLGMFEKVTINSRYTCYNSSSNEFQFSINIGDVDIDEVLVSISGDGASKSLKISNEGQPIGNLVNYPDRSTSIILPGKNAGLTYIFNMDGGGFSGAPDSIKIAPKIEEEQCEMTDSLSEIDDCQWLI